MTTTYVAGECATIVSADGIVLTAPDRLDEVVELGERGLEPLTVVEVLSRGALSELPDFVVVRITGDALRVLVRGAFAVRTEGFAVDGVGVDTWTEASAPLRSGAAVDVAPIGTTTGGRALPLTAGVVRSGGVTWTPEGAATECVVVSAPADDRTVLRAPASPALAAPPVPPTAPPAAPPAAPATAPPAGPPTWHGGGGGDDASADHDGRTITPAQLQAMRAAQVQPGVVPLEPEGAPEIALRLSNGRVVPVRRRVLIGRSPRIQQVGGSANLPALVTVDDPYVSSTHLEVAWEGARVTVTDTSTNGTLLARPGRPPVPLDPGVATEVVVGDVLTLSKGLTATVVPAGGS